MTELSASALRGVCVSAVLMALVVVIGHGERTAASPPRVVAAAAPARAADAWAVEVDGWQIVVDGVVVDRAALRLPAIVPPLAGDADEFRGYGALIGKYAEEAELDWRLVAAVACEESRFDPYAVSPAGAFGLMQVREVAARDVGVSTFLSPEANIRAGVRYLRSMQDLFSAARGRDRQALMLAAYNMGPGHLADAQQLARELGFSPTVWDGSMSEMVRLLEQPVFSSRLPNGYAQGEKVVTYVENVLSRYGQYRRRYPSEPPRATG